MVQQIMARDDGQRKPRGNYNEDFEKATDDDEDNREQLVLRIEGKGSKHVYTEGMMCDKKFKAIIDIGSPVSIFTKRDLQNIIGERKIVN